MSKKRDKELIEFIKQRLTGLESLAEETAGDYFSNSYMVGAMSALFDHILSELSESGERFNTLSLIRAPRPAVPYKNT